MKSNVGKATARICRPYVNTAAIDVLQALKINRPLWFEAIDPHWQEMVLTISVRPVTVAPAAKKESKQ